MTQSATALNKEFEKYEPLILSPLEIEAGFKIVGVYIDEDTTQVPEHCFVRSGYIIQDVMDMSVKHNQIIIQLLNMIHFHLLSKGIEDAADRILYHNRLNVSHESESSKRDETLPDIAVYEGPISPKLSSVPQGMNPILVIEVLSNSTGTIDLTEKKAKYRNKGVKNYWVLKQSDDPKEGLEQSFFFKLRGEKYFDISSDFQESGILKCEDLFGLEIPATEIWFKEYKKHTIAQWIKDKELLRLEKAKAEEAQQRAEQEKQRAEQEKQRADREKQRADLLEQELKKLREQLK